MKVLRNRGSFRPSNANRRRWDIPRWRTQRYSDLALVKKPSNRLPKLFVLKRRTGSRQLWIESRQRIATTRIVTITTIVAATWPNRTTRPANGTWETEGQLERGLCGGRCRTNTRLSARHTISRRPKGIDEIVGGITRRRTELGLRNGARRRSCAPSLRGPRYAIKGTIRTWTWGRTRRAPTTSNDKRIECRPTRRCSQPPVRGRGRPLIGLEFGRSVSVKPLSLLNLKLEGLNA